MGSFYDSDEVEKLFEAAKGTVLEIPVFLGAFYGLRRSEGGQLGIVVQMCVDVSSGRKITMPQPFLNLLHGNAVRQQE